MASLDRGLRRELESKVKAARQVAELGAREALSQLGVGAAEPPPGVNRGLRNRLRAHGRQLGDRLDEGKNTQPVERLAGECAYEHWHRLLFARFLAENDLLVEPVSGMPLSLDECQEMAREQGRDWLMLASEFAQRMLPQIFRAGDPVLEVALPPERRQKLESLLGELRRDVFLADDSLGWVYQFWQSEEKDRVNKSEKKIGAEELPAVTQLFTEDYMVLFLLHNTLGAWWAGKVLAREPEIARTAETEEALRKACALPGIGWEYLRFVKDEGGTWRPAAGTFDGWPKAAKDVTLLDPCMGSGHFLVFALPILVALRTAEEGLSAEAAVEGVLRDNLFGLEIDPRCTQIAAFNLALAAWRRVGHRALPSLQLACCGLGINARESDWLLLAGSESMVAAGMRKLYRLFHQAPLLGSLLDPNQLGGDLFTADFRQLRPLLERALATEQPQGGLEELAVVAKGIALAASVLSGTYTLVVTNVPYLLRRKQSPELAQFLAANYEPGKNDLALAFLLRLRRLRNPGGSLAVVLPQGWLFLGGYKLLREQLLREDSWNTIARLGPGAFQTISGEVVNVCLAILSSQQNGASSSFLHLDIERPSHDEEPKSVLLRRVDNEILGQRDQFRNPDARIGLGGKLTELLAKHASCSWGVSPADLGRFGALFWEFDRLRAPWIPWLGTVDEPKTYGGREMLLRYDDALQSAADQGSAYIRGTSFWGKRGVAVSAMGALPTSLYTGEAFDANVAVLVPHNPNMLPALWAYAQSGELALQARTLDKAIKVTSATFTKVPFDSQEWIGFSKALPLPASTDPTQWLFAGEPGLSENSLQVAVARLLGYRWPRQTGQSFMDAPALGPDGLEKHADEDGIVCLMPLQGEPAAADRLRALLADAFGSDWSPGKLSQLLDEADAKGETLEDWLHETFFAQHCYLFHQRPFVWHLWDGRRDGFNALVNYHKLAGPDGEGHRTLEKLLYSYLGDWIDRQRAEQAAGVEGADGRLAAAQHLRKELVHILEGPPPYDLFVRWKPLHKQPIGWDPDINDGVRLNIRPFMTAKPLGAKAKNACILRTMPKIKWDKDRGKEPYRLREDYPWFWGWDGATPDFRGGTDFDGNRWNDLHYSRERKTEARDGIQKGTHQ